MLNLTQKTEKDMKAVLKYLFILLMLAQIILGMGWMAVNMMHLPSYQESFLLEKAADTLRIDEHMGILYPLLIKIAKQMDAVTGVPYYTLLYLVQLIAAVYAAAYITRYGKKEPAKFSYGVTAAYVVTFPMLLQLHMAVLPYSLAMSIGMVSVCEGLYGLRCTEKVNSRMLIRLSGLWILDVLLLPEYSWLLGIFAGTVFCKSMVRNKECRCRIFICLISAVLCVGVVGKVTQTPGCMGRMQKSVGASLLSRFVWPNFVSYSHFWPEEIAETYETDELTGITKYAEAVEYDFGKILEDKYGREAANDIYWQMALTAFGLDTKQILKDAGRDFMAYLCPPAAFLVQRENNKSALLAWNYGRLQEQDPMLTKYYVNISFAGWSVMCVLGLLLIFAGRRHRKMSFGSVIVGISGVCMAFWYTMQGAGVQDYKKVMLITLLWLLPIVKGFVKTMEI